MQKKKSLKQMKKKRLLILLGKIDQQICPKEKGGRPNHPYFLNKRNVIEKKEYYI